MLDRLDFRLGEIIGLIHALEKRYYQNKTQLRYNFGSVYEHVTPSPSLLVHAKGGGFASTEKKIK